MFMLNINNTYKNLSGNIKNISSNKIAPVDKDDPFGIYNEDILQ